jgi:hypothetical protein
MQCLAVGVCGVEKGERRKLNPLFCARPCCRVHQHVCALGARKTSVYQQKEADCASHANVCLLRLSIHLPPPLLGSNYIPVGVRGLWMGCGDDEAWQGKSAVRVTGDGK